jgi:hypothetical protein
MMDRDDNSAKSPMILLTLPLQFPFLLSLPVPTQVTHSSIEYPLSKQNSSMHSLGQFLEGQIIRAFSNYCLRMS